VIRVYDHTGDVIETRAQRRVQRARNFLRITPNVALKELPMTPLLHSAGIANQAMQRTASPRTAPLSDA